VLPEWARKFLGGQKDEYLQKCLQEAEALREIENTRGYRLITERLEAEITWARKEIEAVNVFHFSRLQEYIRSLNVVLGFIRSTNQKAMAAAQLLSERAESKKPKTVDEYHEEIFGRR
jgi:hypothetical protein